MYSLFRASSVASTMVSCLSGASMAACPSPPGVSRAVSRGEFSRTLRFFRRGRPLLSTQTQRRAPAEFPPSPRKRARRRSNIDMSDGAEEAVENAPAVATTDPPTTPVARTPSQTDAVVIGGTSPRDDDRPPPAFTAEDLRRMEEERVRVQELYLREADLKRREKAVAVAELSSPESLAAMNAERVRRAENFRLEALAKKATRGKDDATPPPPPTAAVATSPIDVPETAWMERERLERRRRYELEAIERRRAAERAVTAEDVLRRKEAEASARRAMAEAMYAPSFVPPPSAVLGPNGDGGDAGGGRDDADAVRVVTLEEVLRAAPTDDAAADDDDAPGDVERGPDTRCDEGDARGRGDGSGGATPDEGKGEGAEADEGKGEGAEADEGKGEGAEDDESPAEGIDADAIDAVVDRLAADADEDEAWDELDETHGAIAYERIPWPDAREISGQSLSGRLPASVERARLDRLAARYDPDEFFVRYGDRIDEAEKARALEKVRQVSRAVEKRRAALRRDL